MELPEEVHRIKEAILQTVPAEQIYLFGSYAYGEPHQDSDFDFYVVLPEDGLRPADALTAIGMAVAGVQTRPVDLLGGRKSVFDRRRQQPGLERVISTKGVKLYERGWPRA